MKLFLFISLPLYALDQWTKWWVLGHIPSDGPRVVVPGWFDLVYVTNNEDSPRHETEFDIAFFIINTIALIAGSWYLATRCLP